MTRLPRILAACILLMAGGSAMAQAFDAAKSPPAPDYGEAESWAARPGREAAAATAAAGATPAAKDAKVDVFYVNPTTFRSQTDWNAAVDDAATNGWNDGSVVARQAAIFNGCCRIFAPRYRQAAGRAVFMLDGEGRKAFDLAYSDVERAFDAYLKQDNGGRPFILVGHSQGAWHIAQLLERRIDGTPLAKRMVAAYVIGINLYEGEFGKRYKALKPCDKPAQTGCVIGWNTVLPELDRGKAAPTQQKAYIAKYGDDPGKRALCINPLTFDRAKPVASRSVSLGAIPGDPDDGPVLPLRKGAVAARCESDGYLVVDVAPELMLKPLPGGSMHFHDMGLFYADIRANAARRVAAFLKARR
ncbi:pimeloyl-ACP methyl ester carboxylesterase [Sphingomonas zeicaulis]|uniref:DUF3089 domain-containing protein n=1 Tax=Sphingomonas zeicaulis TaxID=1632740 RepID=UPI003D1D7D4C